MRTVIRQTNSIRELFLYFAVLTCAVSSAAQSLPFTPFQGYGAKATGGNRVVHVSTLKPTGSGSLTAALASSGHHVVFDIGGTITGSFSIPANTTIDGFSAPLPGITLTGGTSSCLLVHSSNVIIQGLQIRDCSDKDIETYGASGPIHDIVIDHVEMLGSGDEDVATTNLYNYTLSWSIIGNNRNSGCQLIAFGAFHVSDHHNLFYGCNANDSRVPMVAAGNGCCTDGTVRDVGVIADIRYNVSSIFLYGITVVDDGVTKNYGNILNNYLDGQDGDHARNSLDIMGNGHTSYYLSGNASFLNPAGPPSPYYVASKHQPFCVVASNKLDCTKTTIWKMGATCATSGFTADSCQTASEYATPPINGPFAQDIPGRVNEWKKVISEAGVVSKYPDDKTTSTIRSTVNVPTTAVMSQSWNK